MAVRHEPVHKQVKSLNHETGVNRGGGGGDGSTFNRENTEIEIYISTISRLL